MEGAENMWNRQQDWKKRNTLDGMEYSEHEEEEKQEWPKKERKVTERSKKAETRGTIDIGMFFFWNKKYWLLLKFYSSLQNFENTTLQIWSDRILKPRECINFSWEHVSNKLFCKPKKPFLKESDVISKASRTPIKLQ